MSKGKFMEETEQPCTRCHGAGLEECHCGGKESCSDCRGRGLHACPLCQGTGQISEEDSSRMEKVKKLLPFLLVCVIGLGCGLEVPPMPEPLEYEITIEAGVLV